jgi:hypothetical protein
VVNLSARCDPRQSRGAFFVRPCLSAPLIRSPDAPALLPLPGVKPKPALHLATFARHAKRSGLTNHELWKILPSGGLPRHAVGGRWLASRADFERLLKGAR